MNCAECGAKLTDEEARDPLVFRVDDENAPLCDDCSDEHVLWCNSEGCADCADWHRKHLASCDGCATCDRWERESEEDEERSAQ